MKFSLVTFLLMMAIAYLPAFAQKDDEEERKSVITVEEGEMPAHTWFYKETIRKAQDGSPMSMHWLGVMYYRGAGVDKDLDKAFDWLTKSAKKGYAKSMTALGNINRFDPRVDDENQAFKWYMKGAEHNDPEAMLAVGDMLSKGIEGEFPPNPMAALKWYNNAEKANERIQKMKNMQGRY